MMWAMIRWARMSGLLAVMHFTAIAFAQSLPDAKTLLDRMKARMDLVYNDAKTNRFQSVRTNVLEELDAKEQIKKHEVKTQLWIALSRVAVAANFLRW